MRPVCEFPVVEQETYRHHNITIESLQIGEPIYDIDESEVKALLPVYVNDIKVEIDPEDEVFDDDILYELLEVS